MFQEGQTATHKDGRKIVYHEGAWHLMKPDPNAVAEVAPGQQKAPSAETRTRLAIGLGPAVEAQKNLYAAEQWKPGAANPRGNNPLGGFRGALADMIDGDDNNAGWLAKTVGGQRYQDENQAAKSFESAFLPILSGASVTASEAQRLIRASLPQRGDSPTTLAKKGKNRAMMINGAATQVGLPPVFPRTANPTQAPRAAGISQAADLTDPLGLR
jgi:hypothetical protein